MITLSSVTRYADQRRANDSPRYPRLQVRQFRPDSRIEAHGVKGVGAPNVLV